LKNSFNKIKKQIKRIRVKEKTKKKWLNDEIESKKKLQQKGQGKNLKF